MADNAAFVGADAGNAAAITARLAGGRGDLAGRLRVAPGVEIRSVADPQTANLALGSDWNLLPAGGRVGEPMTLTLRSAGNLQIASTLSDGFSTTAANGLAQVGEAASFRLIGGADLSAADPMATRTAGGARGDVEIGRAPSRPNTLAPSVFVRSTTGAIRIAAADDLRQLSSQARVYTTGTPVPLAEVPGFERIDFRTGQLLSNKLFELSPFFENAGDVSLAAGHDVIGAPGTTYTTGGAVRATQYVTDWWYRQTGSNNGGDNGQAVALWSRYDLFGQGFASFGGGDVAVRAGNDVRDLELSTPASGYAVAAGAEGPAAQRWFAGGALSVEAGRDVVSGLFNAGGAKAALAAGGAVKAAENPGLGQSHPATQLFYLDTAWSVSATGGLVVGAFTNTAYLSGTAQGAGAVARDSLIGGLATNASASLLSLAGDVELNGARPQLDASDSRANPDAANQVLPDRLSLLAPGGGIVTSRLLQRPTGDAALQLLADADVKIESLGVAAAPAAAPALPAPEARPAALQHFSTVTGRWNRTEGDGLDASDRSPLVLFSASGNVDTGDSVSVSARPVRLVAPQGDVRLGSELRVQHQAQNLSPGAAPASDFSLIQAGRDVLFANLGASVRLGGPGDLMVIAGRDIDLGGSAGIVSVGNQDNPRALPTGGANLSLLAGVRLGEGDYAAAAASGFQYLGGDRFEEHAAVLAAYFGGGSTPPVPTSAEGRQAAARFRALAPEQQLAEARTIAADDAAYAAAVAGQMRLRPGQAGLTDTQAVAAFEQLGSAERAPLLQAITGNLLAGLADSFSDSQRETFARSIGEARLIDFVERQTGVAGTDADVAAQAFAALPLQRQSLLMNEVLFAELRAAGREALPLTGAERDAAYKKGYDAIAALFPGSARAAGVIGLSGSQVKTQQGGDVRLLAPGGGVNVGELGSGGTPKSPSDLGLITVAGGRIEAMVRDNFDVNQSRVFTLQKGDLLLWSSEGNLDAGRGAKTVTGTPPPVYTIDADGNLVIDTSGSFSGSGIAVLDPASSLDLYAPKGEINAGDAGIRASGNAFFGAVRFVGADNLAVGGIAAGAPPPAVTGGVTAGLSPLGQSATTAANQAADKNEDEDERKKRRRRNLFLDFLGFGSGQ